MSIGLVISIVLAVVMMGAVIAATIWWTQRPLARQSRSATRTTTTHAVARETERQTAPATTRVVSVDVSDLLPLFSNSQGAVYTRDEPGEGENAALISARADRSAQAPRLTAEQTASWTATHAAQTTATIGDRVRDRVRPHAVAPATLSGAYRPPAARTAGRRIVGAVIRFSVPTDASVAFLPGRFVVRSGPDSGQQLRFAALPGERETTVTIGRDDGPPFRHVQLCATDVAARHAELSLREARWWVRHLADGLPTLVDDMALDRNEVVPLVTGTRLQIGSVLFRVEA